VEYDAEDRQFAERIRESLGDTDRTIEDAARVEPWSTSHGYGSTDVGDVSWAVPTAGFSTATWVPGTSAHSWQAIAAGGTDIGIRGMQNAARVLALTAVDLFEDPDLVAEARAEFDQRRGEDFVYRPLLGEREPPLDYRD
jgi:aminobenzoyl-glutamate utilization protein B